MQPASPTSAAEAPYYDTHANWSLIPQHMHGAVRRYVMHGIPPGNFLTAVLCNDLKEAFARADDDNTAAMRGWVQFMYGYMPSNSQGSVEHFRAWIESGGIIGQQSDDLQLRPAGCAHCGETDEFSPNVEAFELCGALLCDDCAEAVFEDNSQFGVGA